MLAFVGCVLASYIAATIRPIDSTELRAADRGPADHPGLAGHRGRLHGRDPDPRATRHPAAAIGLRGRRHGHLGAGAVRDRQGLDQLPADPRAQHEQRCQHDQPADGLSRPFGRRPIRSSSASPLTMFLPIALHYALVDTHRKKFRRAGTRSSLLAWRSRCRSPGRRSSVQQWCSPSSCRPCRPTCASGPTPPWSCSAGFIYITTSQACWAPSSAYSPGSAATPVPSPGPGATESPSSAHPDRSFYPAEATPPSCPSITFWTISIWGRLIELGAVGLFALLLLFLVGIGTRPADAAPSDRPGDPAARSGPDGHGGIGGAYALFDAFSFAIIPGLLFLCLGAIAALRRLEKAEKAAKVEKRLRLERQVTLASTSTTRS